MADLITLKALSELCEELRGLRDDLYNHALITNPSAFAAASALGQGQRQFAVAEMPTASNVPGTAAKVYQNQSAIGVVVVIRVEPNWTSFPPNAIALENSFLLLALSSDEATSADAVLTKHSAGDAVAVIVPPNKTLFVSAMASAAVFVTWRVFPLRGRRLVREVE